MKPLRLAVVACGTVALLAVWPAPPASADYVSGVSGSAITMTGDGASEALLIDSDGSDLRHNRWDAEDDGYASSVDFSSGAGAQNVQAAPTVSLTLNGGSGDDVIVVRPLLSYYGSSNVDGGPGADVVTTGTGVDVIAANDGVADSIACGPGVDSVSADALDAVFSDCETVTRPPVPAKKKCKKKGKAAVAAKKKCRKGKGK